METTDIPAIALVVVGAFLAFKVGKTIVKLLMLAVVAAGLYLWFGV